MCTALIWMPVAGAAESAAEAAPFSLTGTALFAAASAPRPPDASDLDLIEVHESYVFDADGSDRYTQYLVYKILTPAGAENWKSLSMDWAPWLDEKPAIRARVIATDGTSYTLDQATVTDSPAHSTDPSIYSDARSLRAPLPAIAPGAVVESEIVMTERLPFSGAGKVGRSYFQLPQPVQHFRLLLQAPESVPLRYRADLLPGLTPKQIHEKGIHRWVFDMGPTPAAEERLPGLPGDVYAFPMITFSTGGSWRELAQAYSNIVAARLAEAKVTELTTRLITGRTSREAKASVILEYLNREIRYTGIEFGQASVMPHTTAETLAHRYGDCKDKSLLLVAMLHAAGIPANLALLNAGEQLDVPSELPGMGLFNHAIVAVPGEPALWIDATAENARLGQLPNADRGRAALIVDADTVALTRVDEARSTDNVIFEEREIRLADHGPARAAEVSRPRGTFESDYRRAYADLSDKETRANLTDYFKSEYLAERLERLTRSDPRDFAQPFRLSLEGARAGRGQTTLNEAVAYIRLEGLFNQLPSGLRTREPTDEENAKATRPARKRVADYLLSRPFVTEWHYRIVPPAGFQPAALPLDVSLALGPAAFTERFSVEEDGVVRAELRFDSGQRRFTPGEQSALRNKIAELLEGEAIKIKFDLQAHLLLAKGQARESFQAYRSLIAQQPKDAMQYLRRADALLTAGMGEAARGVAALAIRLDPKSAFAQETLATILQSDLIGRWHRPGADLAGAAAAYRAAIALDADNKELVGDYAILLEHDPLGVRYGAGADLKAAIAQYRKLTSQQLSELGIANNLPFALFYARDFEAALQAASLLDAPVASLVVACDAVLKGPPYALEQARRLADGDVKFKETVATAGQMLMNVREYPGAAALLEAGASGASTARTMGLVAVLRRAKRHEELTFSSDAEGFIRHMLVTMMAGPLSIESLISFSSRNARLDTESLAPEEREQTLQALNGVLAVATRSGVPLDVMIDISLQAMQVKSLGNDALGYRELVQGPNMRDQNFFIVREDGEFRVLDTAEKPIALALEVLERLGRQDLAGASALLGWVREARPSENGDDPYGGDPFVRFWPAGEPHEDAHTITLAAAALLVEAPRSARRGIVLLEQARAGAAAAESENIDLALLAGYEQLQDHEHALAAASALAARTHTSRRMFHARCIQLRALGRFKEADELARQRLQTRPDDVDALRALEHNSAAQHDYAGAYELGLKVVASASAVGADLNDLAWMSLYFDRTGGPDLDSALRAAQERQNNPAVLHTLGCLYAEAGKTREAREVLLQAMDARNLLQPNSEFWYAFGRIAEQFDEREAALANYARVTPPKDPALEYFSTYHLAQNRVLALRGRPAAAKSSAR